MERHLIPGWDAYAYTDDGKLWSQKSREWREIGTGIGLGGYYHCILFQDGKRWATTVHRVIASVTLGPCPAGHTVDHINRKQRDNRPENLQYLTHKAQVKHLVTVAEEDLEYIFQLSGLDLTQQEIGAILQVSNQHVGKILNGRRRAS